MPHFRKRNVFKTQVLETRIQTVHNKNRLNAFHETLHTVIIDGCVGRRICDDVLSLSCDEQLCPEREESSGQKTRPSIEPDVGK